jgi:hypothetical protein
VTKPGKVEAARMVVVATAAIAFEAKLKWEGITIVIDNSMDSKTKIEEEAAVTITIVAAVVMVSQPLLADSSSQG